MQQSSEPIEFAEGGRIWTIECPCKWEAVYVLPEDCFRLILALFQHTRESHANVVPAFKMQSH